MRKLLLGLALAMALPVFAAEHWIDVRVPQQYQKEHVDGAVNIPLADLKTRIAAEVPDKTIPFTSIATLAGNLARLSRC